MIWKEERKMVKNYYFIKNKELFEKMDNKIDKLPELNRDVVNTINALNKDYDNPLEYDESKNVIFQSVGDRKYTLGVDFIGPSAFIAEMNGIDENSIFEFQYQSRIMGGHLLFPTDIYKVKSKPKSLNQIRSYRFEERIDYFLFELSLFSVGKNKVEASAGVFEGNRKWFEQFGKFPEFVDFFKLNDFVSENYEVYDLSSLDDYGHMRFIQEQPDVKYKNDYKKALMEAYSHNYKNYIKGCVSAIQKRDERIKKLIG